MFKINITVILFSLNYHFNRNSNLTIDCCPFLYLFFVFLCNYWPHSHGDSKFYSANSKITNTFHIYATKYTTKRRFAHHNNNNNQIPLKRHIKAPLGPRCYRRCCFFFKVMCDFLSICLVCVCVHIHTQYVS